MVITLSYLRAFTHRQSFYFRAIPVGLSISSSLKSLTLMRLIICFGRVVQINRLARFIKLDDSISEVASGQLGRSDQYIIPAQHFIRLAGLVSISVKAKSGFVSEGPAVTLPYLSILVAK